MSSNWLLDCIEKIKGARIALLGEFCLDAYWWVSGESEEISVETGLPVHHVREQRYSLGGASNVAANLRALEVERITAIGVIGRDPFGDVLIDLLSGIQAGTNDIIRDQSDWQTCVYAKRYIAGVEQSRIDFGSFNVPSESTLCKLEESINRSAETHDLLIVNQQIPNGLFQKPLIAAVNRLAENRPHFKIIVDSRHFAGDFRGASLKVNAAEASLLVKAHCSSADSNIVRVAQETYSRMTRPVFITRGDRGIVVADKDGVHEVPGIHVPPPIDIVGAGDAALASISAVMAVNDELDSQINAAQFANIAATVTLKKLQVTGTASPSEILLAGADADYIYSPELAADVRLAHYIDGSEIERVRPLPENLRIRHAIFDHDGTLSTLREGWESIMEPMMIRAILGERYGEVDRVLFAEVTGAVHDLIDRTTGIQTLVQMNGLVDLVHEFGCVPESGILDNHGYKKIYNDDLLKMVRKRIDKLNCGELSRQDFQIKNAHELLKALHNRGVTMYLASGTDVADVIEEARAMGYAELFGDRIFGAVGDVTVEAKKIVLEEIITENSLSGSSLVTFGDGPVEIRETRKREGVAVGIASDEVRTYGLNQNKRKRLIRAGADLIVPDFSQIDQLLKVINL
jgi:rfaE bifunctional protein kinase chain/domain